MSRFLHLGEDKLTIMMKLLESQELCKALYYNQSNFKEQPDIASPPILIYDRIHPYRFIPKIEEEKKSYITLSFGGYKSVKGYYKAGIVSINCFTHQDLFRTDYGILRTDYLLYLIDTQINGLKELGIGGADFYMMDELYVNEMYSGNRIAYKLYDFD